VLELMVLELLNRLTVHFSQCYSSKTKSIIKQLGKIQHWTASSGLWNILTIRNQGATVSLRTLMLQHTTT
jgi:hypothetical protein